MDLLNGISWEVHLTYGQLPEITPCGLILVGPLKLFFHNTPVEIETELTNQIIAGDNLIRNDPCVFERVLTMRRRWILAS